MKKNFLLIICALFIMYSYSQELKTGTYMFNQKSILIHEANQFEIYDHTWNEGFEIPYGSGKYRYTGDSLIMTFNEVDTLKLTRTMTDVLTVYNRDLKNKNQNTTLQVFNQLTGFPIPEIIVTTVNDTLFTNQYGEIEVKGKSKNIALTLFSPHWSIVTEPLIFDIVQPQLITVNFWPPTYVPYRSKKLRFSIEKVGNNTYVLHSNSILLGEMKFKRGHQDK